MTSFVAVLAKNTHVCGCRPVLYYFKVNISLLKRFIKPVMVIMDRCVLQPHYFLPRKPPFWRKIGKFCCCYGPKHMYICGRKKKSCFEHWHGIGCLKEMLKESCMMPAQKRTSPRRPAQQRTSPRKKSGAWRQGLQKRTRMMLTTEGSIV